MVAQQAKREGHVSFNPRISQGSVTSRRRSSGGSSPVRLPEVSPRKDPFQLASAEKETPRSSCSDVEDHDNRIQTQGHRRLVASGQEAETAATQEELVIQLKTVIRAQHAKIEELRKQEKEKDTMQSEKQPETIVSTNVHLQMIEELKRDASRDREALSKMTSQVRRLQNLLKDLREENQDLKHGNKRYAGMLSGLGPHSAAAAVPSTVASATMPLSARTPAISSTALPIAHQSPSWPPQLGATAGAAMDPSPVVPPSSAVEAGALTARGGKVNGTMRLTQAMRGVFGLWREETPAAILISLMGSACSLLQGGPPAITTLFVVDSWLRSAMETRPHDTAEDSARLQPTKFYLKGQATVCGYQRQPGRVEPPRFADLSCLPNRSLGQLVLPVHAKDKPMYAVVQVVIPRATDSLPVHGPVGRPRVRDALQGVTDEDNLSERSVALTDAQISGLELLCGTAASIIETHLRSTDEQTIRKRSEECLAIAAEISSVPRLTDFEHAVKILLLKFFHVACVRLCFYDSDSHVLLTVPTRPHRSGSMAGVPDEEDDAFQTAPVVGRRRLQRISTKNGIVGKCVRKMQVIHSESLAGSVEVSERADGVDMAGWTTDINMLTGPMVANLSQKVVTIGTLQIIEKKSSSVDGSSTRTPKARPSSKLAECIPFSEEDQRFFSSMLKVLGLAAYRTMQLQARNDMAHVAIHVETLLER